MYVDDGWSLQINQQALSLLISACWQGRVILPQDHERQMAFIAGLTQTSDYAGLRQLLVADNSYMVADTDSFNFEVALGRLVAEYDGADHGADGIAYLAGMPAPAGIADQTPERLLPFLPEAVEAAVLDGTLSTATVDEHIARRRQADLQRELEAIYSDHHHTSAYLQRTFLGRLADAIRGYDPDLRIVAGGEPSYADGKWILDLKVEDTSGANPPEPLSEWLLFGGNVHPPLSALSAEWWAGHQVAYDLDNTWRVLAKASKEA
ncbi:hypothetical protein JXA59_01115 [Patescibacteria group bacterium]|nr:hypothetical protein [Patescibacteria group bacterium]